MSIVGAIRRLLAAGFSIGQALLAAEAFEAEAQAVGGRDNCAAGSLLGGVENPRARSSHAERQRRYRERKRRAAEGAPAADEALGGDVMGVTGVTPCDAGGVTRVTEGDAMSVARDAKVTLCDAEPVTCDAEVTPRDASREGAGGAHRDNYARAPGFPVGLSYESPPLESPLPSEGPQTEKPKRRSGMCLPEDWTPEEELFDYGRSHGLSREQTASILEDMRLWAIANRNRAIARKADWAATAKGFIRRDAMRALARAGPRQPSRRNPFLVDFERELSEQNHAADWQDHDAPAAGARVGDGRTIDLLGDEYHAVDGGVGRADQVVRRSRHAA